jgi:hypothetical protein
VSAATLTRAVMLIAGYGPHLGATLPLFRQYNNDDDPNEMCGSRNQDEQFSSARGSWLAADVLEGNEQKTARDTEGKTNHAPFLSSDSIGLVQLPFGGALDSNC